ncbi:MAG: Ni/Fe-hydrogenase, b-type cytochrome subunit [Gemmatimonadota bacterium]|nr:MAG: Ni/Fe-hydrogenase, b-type cytochrome subunit [Gemmatimonadota bacterium]
MNTAASIDSAAASAVQPQVIRVYVWDLPVRLTHWLLTGSIVVLAITGFYIGHPFITAPDPAGQEFVMGTVLAIHFFAAIVFSLSELARIVWMFVGNKYARWNQMIPVSKARWRSAWEWLKFYVLFRPVTPRFVGHNPLAGMTYMLVYAVCLLSALTGYAIFSVSAGIGSPMQVFSVLVPLFGGLQTARWIHHLCMWLLVLFVIHHVSCALLVARAAKNAAIDSMFSGYRFVRPEDLEAEEAEE